MEWIVWIFPILAVAGWIITSLLKNANEGKKEAREGRARPRRPGGASDLDRFLREVQQRKRATETRPPPAEEEVPIVEAVPVSVFAPPSVLTPPVMTQLSGLDPVRPVVFQLDPLPGPEVVNPPLSATNASMKTLLATRTGLRTAILLQEILAPPLALRPRPPRK